MRPPRCLFVALALALAAPVGVSLDPGAAYAQTKGKPKKKPEPKAPNKGKKPPKGGPKSEPKPVAQGKPRPVAPVPVAQGPLAPPPEAPTDKPTPLAVPGVARDVTLTSGLRVLVSPDASPTAGMAVVCSAYDAGARHEAEGASGAAELARRVASRTKSAALVRERGGSLTSTASLEATTFCAEVPSGELALALAVEAERLRGPSVDEASLAAAREAALLDARERAEAPVARGRDKLPELAFQGNAALQRSVFGTEDKLAAVSLEAVRAHAKRYEPGSAVVVLSGAVDPTRALELAEQHLGAIQKRPVSHDDASPVPDQTSQRAHTIEDAAVSAPTLLYAFAAPKAGTAEHASVAVALAALGGGEGSRLHDSLRRDKGLANVRVSLDEASVGGLARLELDVYPGVRVADVQRALEAELKAFSASGPSEVELVRATRRLVIEHAAAAERPRARAEALSLRALAGRPLEPEAAQKAWLAVDAAAVKGAATTWLSPIRRTLVEVLPPAPKAEPKKASAPSAEPPGKPHVVDKSADKKAEQGDTKAPPKKDGKSPKKDEKSPSKAGAADGDKATKRDDKKGGKKK